MFKRPSLFALLFPLFLLFTSLAYTADFRWTEKADMSAPRSDFAAATIIDATTGKEKIYVFGGMESSGPNPTTKGIHNSIEMYDPSTNRWSIVGYLSQPRRNMAVAVVNQKVYIIGGGMEDGTQSPLVEEFDPVTNTCVVKSSMTVARFCLGVAAVDNKIYAIGGYNHFMVGHEPLSVVEEYDVAHDTWTTKTSMPTARWTVNAVAVNNRIYVIGGHTGLVKEVVPQKLTPVVEMYDPGTDTWTTKTPMPIPRYYPCAAILDNVVYVIGGLGLENNAASDLNRVEAYDAAHDAWTTKTSMVHERFASAAAVAYNHIYVMGGNTSWTYYFSTVEAGELVTVSASPVADIHAYPSPACLSKGDLISFAHVAPHTTITILSPGGYVVKTLHTDETGLVTPWNGVAEDGQTVGSGTYIVHASDTNNNVAVFSILIIR